MYFILRTLFCYLWKPKHKSGTSTKMSYLDELLHVNLIEKEQQNGRTLIPQEINNFVRTIHTNRFNRSKKVTLTRKPSLLLKDLPSPEVVFDFGWQKSFLENISIFKCSRNN